MMLTPKQASAMWCPMVRVAAQQPDNLVLANQVVFNRLQKGPDVIVPTSGCCIADKCAMWRWGETKTEWQLKVVELGQGMKRADNVPVEVPTSGYCGLAGTPKIAGGLQP
jgi:hypothetical protein